MSNSPDSDLFYVKQNVIAAVKNLIAAEWSAEAHPEDAHGADGVDYAEDQLDDALTAYADRVYGGPRR